MPAPPDPQADAIVDAALQLAALRGWDAVHLHEVARAAGVTLADVARHFDHKDAVAEAWFDRADRALLAAAQTPGWGAMSPRGRLHGAVAAWLGALAPHRALARQMVGYKLQPEHVHLQVQALLRISRTVQWLREVAALPGTGWRREAEEAALSAIFVATFVHWLRDGSAGAERTLAFLDRRLAAAERVARWLPG